MPLPRGVDADEFWSTYGAQATSLLEYYERMARVPTREGYEHIREAHARGARVIRETLAFWEAPT
jgi:hypothetical protein